MSHPPAEEALWLTCVCVLCATGPRRCCSYRPHYDQSACCVRVTCVCCLLCHQNPPALTVLPLLSVFQGLCLRGERQKHAGLKVPRVPMWYSRRSHCHQSSRNLLQSGCHYLRPCMNELICCCGTSYWLSVWQASQEKRGRKVLALLTEEFGDSIRAAPASWKQGTWESSAQSSWTRLFLPGRKMTMCLLFQSQGLGLGLRLLFTCLNSWSKSDFNGKSILFLLYNFLLFMKLPGYTLALQKHDSSQSRKTSAWCFWQTCRSSSQ